MNYLQGKIIAVDFDGTIVEHAYPRIGKEMLFAFATLRALQQKGHRLILWTYRRGALLEEAILFCKQNDLIFYAVNENFPDEPKSDGKFSRKINADIFIDDRNIGGFLGWENIWQLLHPEGGAYDHQLKNPAIHQNLNHKRKRFLFW